MSLATRAYVEYALSEAKQSIDDAVMLAARKGQRRLEIPCLPCNNEHVGLFITWMKSEGLSVEHKKWKDKPRGLGGSLCEDDELVEYSKFVISF